MTREKAIETLKLLKPNMRFDNSGWLYIKQALEMAIQALSQEPCDDTVSIRKDVLKCRVGKLVVYNVEWLKKHWQMEMDIVCGVKPCDDAISRDAVLSIIDGWYEQNRETENIEDLIILITYMDSVTQKSGKCKNCKWWRDSDGVYRRGVGAESQCPINRREVYEGNGYCYMFEPQERSDKE